MKRPVGFALQYTALQYTALQYTALLMGWLMLGATGLGAMGLSTATDQPESTCRAELSRQIQAITSASTERWGILAENLGSARPLYAQNADQLFIPASNVKLLTTAAALTKLGAGFRIRTSVYQTTEPDGTISLRLVGRGDPSLRDLQLQQLAQQISRLSIRQVDRLIADDQYFRGVFFNPTWEQEDREAGYGAPFNSLILNQNAIGLTLMPQAVGQPLEVRWDDPSEGNGWQIINRSTTAAPDGSEFLTVGRDLSRPVLRLQGQLRARSAPEPVAVSIPDPASYFLTRFQQALEAEQIQIQQSELADQQSEIADQQSEIAAVESAPLSDLLIETNRQSNNLYAEALLRQIAGQQTIPSIFPSTSPSTSQSALDAGIQQLRASLNQLGVSADYRLADGSGLSRQNQVSPQVLVETLQAMQRSRYASLYRASLAKAGVNGTLAARFKNTPVQGQFLGKTGSLRGVAALSGYLQTGHLQDRHQQQPELAVSILVNATAAESLQPKVDAVLQALERLGSC